MGNFIAAFFSSLIIGFSAGDGEGQNNNLILVFSSLSAAFSVISIVCSTIDFVFKPQSTAEQAGFSKKCYEDLFREIEVEILSEMKNEIPLDRSGFYTNRSIGESESNFISYEKYKARLLYFSSREQIISVNEPGLALIGYRKKTVTTSAPIYKLPLSTDEIQFMAKYLSKLPNSNDRNKAEYLIAKILDIHNKGEIIKEVDEEIFFKKEMPAINEIEIPINEEEF